jgi:O-methyltransferase
MVSRATIKRAIPPRLLNRVLLTFPFIYRIGFVNFETNLDEDGGIENLLSEVDAALALSGDIVECGSSRCGTTVILAAHLRRMGSSKKIYACDSFEGFDRAEFRQEQELGWTKAPEDAFTSTSYDYVLKKIAKLGFSGTIIPIKGYFQQTLPKLEGPISLGLVDCDLKDSLVFSAYSLWPRLVKGGRLLFDDYKSENWMGARLGIDEFISTQREEIATARLLSRLYVVEKK